MTDTNNITVPINKLDHDPRNVRQTYEAAGLCRKFSIRLKAA